MGEANSAAQFSTVQVWNNNKVKIAAIPKPQLRFGKTDLLSLGQRASPNSRALGTYMSEGTWPTDPSPGVMSATF